MTYEIVKFYNDGGHSAGRVAEDRPGIVVRISNERYEEIAKDEPGTLRSPYGKPAPITE